MPASQSAATERRNDRTVTHEPPKLKTTLKTPPKQATNPLQFVKVGPCSLYRTAQEQLQKVQEVKKIKQEVREEPEDWQSNLDNWKSSRRKRQEHIIERVVEVKKLELEEHDRQRRRSKTFSEMMEERGNRGRKLSMSLAMYHEEDSNDLSDLGIGTSSGKSSVSGDTHDDAQSVLSDRDSEIEKNHSDVDNTPTENGNDSISCLKKSTFGNGFHNNNHNNHEYDSAATATASSPEPEEYTYEGAIRGYVSRVSQNIPRRSLVTLDAKLDNSKAKVNGSKTSLNEETNGPVAKVDILKRREIFEKGSPKSTDNKINNRLGSDFPSSKSIKERLSHLEKQKSETETVEKSSSKALNRLSGDMNSIRERLSHLEKQASEREKINIHDDLETVRPLRERLSTLEKYSSSDESTTPATPHEPRHSGELSARSIKDRLSALDSARNKELEKRNSSGKHALCFSDQENRVDNSTPSERSSSPDSEYRAPRAAFHRSLDSLDADASSGPDTFERVQSLEELDYTRRYPASTSSAEILNDTDREDSGIHTADVSCSVSQADEPIDEEVLHNHVERQQVIEEKPEPHILEVIEIRKEDVRKEELRKEELRKEELRKEELRNEQLRKEKPVILEEMIVACQREAVTTMKEPAVIEKTVEEIICQTIKPVDREEVETTGTPLNAEIEMVSQQKTEEDSEPVAEESEVISVPPVLEKPERPSTLNFVENQKPMEMFSPMSQGSTPIFPLNLTSDEEIVAGLSFPMGPPTSVEPPKEKPPPPPVELSDEESQPVEPLKRLNSTRRIKKELRTRRSDFLGIGGVNDDDYEQELSLTKPPDMAAILAEERRIEQLHRRSYDTDSNYEQDSNHERDSGVELGHVEDWTKQPVSPDISQHSRQSSEPFGASVTSSEEDEITKKEREIIEVLEKEEQWRYGNSRELNSDIGEKLAHKLRELEEEKMQLERERAQEAEEQRRQEEIMRKNEENIRKQEEILRKQQDEIERQEDVTRVQEAKRMEDERKEEELRIQAQEKLKIQSEVEEKEKKAAEARRQEEIQNKTLVCATQYNNQDDEFSTENVLRVERELLQLEQEELQRKRNNLAYREQKQQQLAQQLEDQWKSLQDVANGSPRNLHQYKLQTLLNYRSSMPNLQMQDVQRRRPPPPPIPPAKPLRMVEQRQRDVTINRNSRVPSADSIPQQLDASIRHSASATMLTNHGGQQMTRQTLQALSAVPRPRIVQGDQWVQRRKSDVPRGAQDYNYQHWLIQEAEQRRINEKNQRSPVRKPQQHVTGTSVPYTASPPRSDIKPLPDSIIQTLTQRVQARAQEKPLQPRRRLEQNASQELPQKQYVMQPQKVHQSSSSVESQEKMLSVSGKKKCSHCGDELGRGAAMIIESLRLFYHMECFKCCVCHVRLGDGLMGTDVRVRNHKLHCHNCYSSDDGVKFSCV